MRENLIRLAIIYQGDYYKIKKALERNEIANDEIPLQQAITIYDSNYPKSLFELSRPPYVLFYQGNIKLLENEIVALIGSRKASQYGIESTIDIVNRIKNKFVIISGLAAGIDTVAHRYASKTIAVIGNGIDVVYPLENKKAYEYISSKQLIISEYPKGTKPSKYHFPRRNCIIAALAKKIIVTQAAIHSGTMLTVKQADRLNRPVYAVVYPYQDIYGVGCNNLISEGKYLLMKENIEYLLCEEKIGS